MNRKSLKWKSHIYKVITETKMMANLYSLMCGNMILKNKLMLIKTIARPTLTYESASWWQAAASYIRRASPMENILPRQTANAPH